MILYTTTARESFKASASKAREKISRIPGNVLSYGDARDIGNLLVLLEEYIDAEERASKKCGWCKRGKCTLSPDGNKCNGVKHEQEQCAYC